MVGTPGSHGGKIKENDFQIKTRWQVFKSLHNNIREAWIWLNKLKLLSTSYDEKEDEEDLTSKQFIVLWAFAKLSMVYRLLFCFYSRERRRWKRWEGVPHGACFITQIVRPDAWLFVCSIECNACWYTSKGQPLKLPKLDLLLVTQPSIDAHTPPPS